MAPVGVEIATSVVAGTSNTGVRSGRFHVAGLTERGPVNAHRVVRSLAQFETVYGKRTPYSSALYDTARLFWEEGGDELIVSRAVGPAASNGALALVDRAAAPLPTLSIEARNPGSYSSEFTVEVVAGLVPDSVTIKVRQNGVLVANLANLTSVLAAVEASGTNDYIRVIDLGSTTAAPGNLPALRTPTAMPAGNDDRAAVTAASMIEALEKAGPEHLGAAVAVPGYPVDIIGEQLMAHAAAYQKIALMAFEAGTTMEDVALISPFDRTFGDSGAIIFPHVLVPDGNATRTISPEGYAAAVRARAHVSDGFWRAPPGDPSVSRWIQGTAVPLTSLDLDALEANNVNGIITMGGKPRLYGWNSLKEGELLSTRDSLNNIAARLKTALEQFVFRNIDGKGILLSEIESAATGVLSEIAAGGGLYARYDEADELVDDGFSVSADESLNPIETQAQNIITLRVGVRLSPMAKHLKVQIIKVPLNATV